MKKKGGARLVEETWRDHRGRKCFWDVVERMCQIRCTQAEIAAVMGCHIDTLNEASKRCHGKTFEEYKDSMSGVGRASLRRMQWQKAESGNTTMLIWLGKNLLGQTDKLVAENHVSVHDHKERLVSMLSGIAERRREEEDPSGDKQ